MSDSVELGPLPVPRGPVLLDDLLQRLLAYWDAKRDGRAMPARADLDPTDIPRLLPHLMLTDVLADGGFRYRLVGTEVERSFGARMTGKRIDELMFGDYLAYITALYRRVVEAHQPIYASSRYGSADGGDFLFTERVMLPLSADGRTVDMVISAQIFRHAHPLDERTAVALQHLADHDLGAVVATGLEADSRP